MLLRLVAVCTRGPSVITRILSLLKILALAGTLTPTRVLVHHLSGGCGSRHVLLVKLVSVLLLKYAMRWVMMMRRLLLLLEQNVVHHVQIAIIVGGWLLVLGGFGLRRVACRMVLLRLVGRVAAPSCCCVTATAPLHEHLIWLWLLVRGAHLVRSHLRLLLELATTSTVVDAWRLLCGGWRRRRCMRRHHLDHSGGGGVHPRSRSVLRVGSRRCAHHLSRRCRCCRCCRCCVVTDRFDFEDVVVVVVVGVVRVVRRLLVRLEQTPAWLGDHAGSWLSGSMRVEILREIVHATLFHHSLQRIQVCKVGILTLFELPDELVGRWDQFINHIVVVVNLQQVVDHKLVIWHVSVVERLDVIEYLLHFFDAFGRSDP